MLLRLTLRFLWLRERSGWEASGLRWLREADSGPRGYRVNEGFEEEEGELL